MAGIMAKGMDMTEPPGKRPDEVFNSPWMRESNPIMDLLIRAFAQTEKPKPPRKKPEQRQDEEAALVADDVAKRTADVKGPFEAKFAKEHTKKRNTAMRDIY